MKIKNPKIAVVSMAGIFPEAKDTDRFIANILNRKDAVSQVPEERWAAPAHVMVAGPHGGPDKAASDRAGLITEFDFCPRGFNLSPDLLMALDPLHHLVLSAGQTALAKTRTTPELLEKTGVILAAIALPTSGSSRLAQQMLLRTRPEPVHPYAALGATVVSTPAAVLARALNCKGGSFTLDAACASSLFAVKLACEQLMSGKADLMIAGGVSRPDSLYTQVGFTQLSALSPSGICAPFDRTADGLVVGEGTGILVLKRLDDAVGAGDTIHGVIAGWGVSNDIQGNLVAPASEGQVRAMAAAYDMAGWRLSDIQYLECHGSGTPKGDQVELSTIMEMVRRHGCPDHELAIGSVKSMIGHLLTAAGAAGLIKTLLAMNARTLPPSLHFSELSQDSPIRDSRIRVQAEAEDWPQAPVRAGVSAFGFGGINAHILVEAYEEKRPFPATPPEREIPRACAIVGMAVHAADIHSLDAFDRALFSDQTPAAAPSGSRFRREFLPEDRTGETMARFMSGLDLSIKDFHIPPNQMPDILFQHIIMLKAARDALKDAGIRPRPSPEDPLRHTAGCAVGIEFDFGAADFDLRWRLHGQPDTVRDGISPPLTFDRTLGALGGIVASRIAREFKLGGPCFTLSAGSASGIKAVETALHSLNSGETDVFVCGAVDMAGDLCTYTINRALGAFDTGILPAEGSAAIVLKRLDRAVADKDRIYAVVDAAGGANGSPLAAEKQPGTRDTAFTLSRERVRGDAPPPVFSAGPGTTDGQGLDPAGRIGHTGAASGLISVMAAGLALSQGRTRGPASAHCITLDGAAAHAWLSPYAKTAGQRPAGLPAEVTQGKDIRLPAAKQKIPLSLIRTLNPPEPSATGLPPLDTGRAADLLAASHDATAKAHEAFLSLSSRNFNEMGRQVAALANAGGERESANTPPPVMAAPVPDAPAAAPLLDRNQCLEYAVGKAGNVLGPAFDIIDTYPVRVRLPAEPLMLVDRIMDIQGEMLSLTKGKIITQHDVREGAWYLDGNRAPVSISIEAGQADLFLCAWLGIDHVVKGKRKYRLLDARVTFHRGLPKPGETIEYHIEIDRFLRQGEIFLFFFHYTGFINGQPFISMRDGCAGFFTEEEVKNSGGIILKTEEKDKAEAKASVPPLVPMAAMRLDEGKVSALRKGDLETAFGPEFKGVAAGKHQWLPGGRMTLIHRVLDLDPLGGRYGLGKITAEADIHPDDWFLTCHFIDDMVMPGTLMYECCAHALRIFIQRMGWVSASPDARFQVLPGNESDLRCRGPVTPKTRKARYEIEIRETGYGPEPYVRADAHMFSDDLRIVLYKNMGMTLSNVLGQDLMDFWSKR